MFYDEGKALGFRATASVLGATSLMYHDVVAGDDADLSGFPGAAAALYKLSRPLFERHMEAIAAAGQTPQLVSASDWPSRAPLFLTFDDGGISAAEVIAPLLERRGWLGHFFMTTNCIGRPGFLSPQQLRELATRGHLIGSHSASHPTRMSQLTRNELLQEWTSSRVCLEDILGTPVETASVPGGYYSDAVGETAAEAGYRVLFYSEPTTRVRSVASCRLLGRYYLQHGTNESTAAGFAAGRWGPCLRQALLWKVKKAVKLVAGGPYLKLRRMLLEQR
jgi:peptidoglycan/xylan/chitin deacetylase (PgdA/CDA1 family)